MLVSSFSCRSSSSFTFRASGIMEPFYQFYSERYAEKSGEPYKREYLPSVRLHFDTGFL